MKSVTSVSECVDQLILEQDLPVRAGLKPIRKFDGLYPEDAEEAEAYWDFIRWSLCQEHASLMSVPIQERNKNFLPFETDNSISFPFSSADFQKRVQAFNVEHWRTKKVLEKVENLALLFSVVGDPAIKENVRIKFVRLVEKEYLSQARLIAEHVKKYGELMNRDKAEKRVLELNRKIRACRRVWNKNAYTE
jgi:hypothetical protein